MKNKLPAELHLVHGTKPAQKNGLMTEQVKRRVPCADWLNNPDAWDRNRFITETSEFLWDTYGIGSDQDKHILGALAMQLEIYISCIKGIQENGIVTTTNSGQTQGVNPYITASDKALSRAITLMNELGLTPKNRLATNKQEGGKYSKLLNGP